MGYNLQGRFFKRLKRFYTVSHEEMSKLSKEGNSLPEGASAQDALMFVAVNAHDMPTPIVDFLTPTRKKVRKPEKFMIETDAEGNWRIATLIV